MIVHMLIIILFAEKVMAGAAINHKVTLEDNSEVSAPPSNFVMDKDKYADDGKKKMRLNDIKTENIDAKLSPENAVLTRCDLVVRSSKRKLTLNGKDISKGFDKSKQKDQEKLLSLIRDLEDRGTYTMMSDTKQDQLKQWLSDIQLWEENRYAWSTQRFNKPIQYGAKHVDNHSMGEKGLRYKGEENIDRKPHGQGKVIFENGDWMVGEFKDGLRHGLGTIKTDVELSL